MYIDLIFAIFKYFFPFCRSTAFLIAKTALFSVQHFFVDRLKAFKIGIFCSSNGFKWQIVKVLSAKNPLSFHKVKASNNYVHKLFPQKLLKKECANFVEEFQIHF